MPSPPWPWDFEWGEFDATARELADLRVRLRTRVLADLAVETDPDRIAELQLMLERLDAPGSPTRAARWWRRRR